MNDSLLGLLESVAAFLRAAGIDAHIYDVAAVLALGLVSLACGLIGPFIVGNRMAFFSDAMAHTAFAGAALGMLALLLAVNPVTDAHAWIISAVMAGFGILVGLAIAFVRERTGLSADAVIGVFFAFAVGFGAMLIPPLRARVNFDSEAFIFGSALFASPANIVSLAVVVLLAALFVMTRYNGMALAGFNPSLARTRNVSVRMNNYLFIVLLSLVVNLSIQAVGVMLINALLIVPAAAAANIARNVRQLSLYTLLFSVGCTLGGFWLCQTTRLALPGMEPLELRPGGTIVILCVLLFFGTALLGALRGRRIHGADCC